MEVARGNRQSESLARTVSLGEVMFLAILNRRGREVERLEVPHLGVVQLFVGKSCVESLRKGREVSYIVGNIDMVRERRYWHVLSFRRSEVAIPDTCSVVSAVIPVHRNPTYERPGQQT